MKKILIYALILLIPFIFVSQTYAKTSYNIDTYILLDGDKKAPDLMEHTCQDFANVFRIGGYIILLLKIAVPLIIIVQSSISLLKVVTGGTPEELKKQASKLVTSCVAGVIIFFVPTIINTAMSLVNRYKPDNDAKICQECIFNPTGSTCTSAIKSSDKSEVIGVEISDINAVQDKNENSQNEIDTKNTVNNN